MDARVSAQPGPLAEEAAKLVDALTDWARGAHGELPLATDSQECALCPFCQLLGVLRHTKPETFAHLAQAGASLAAAMRSVMDSAATAGGHPRTDGVQRIDLDDDQRWRP